MHTHAHINTYTHYRPKTWPRSAKRACLLVHPEQVHVCVCVSLSVRVLVCVCVCLCVTIYVCVYVFASF
jgi:hypothetical protein